MRNYLKLFLLLLLIVTVLFPEQKRPYREKQVYFPNTPNELNVYKLYGRFDGNTVFILGGIQGDEPGGFLSADLYPNLVLERGNLIVVPRANFKSIIRNHRGINGDMNRRFDKDTLQDIDDQIVSIIKSLMAESDLFLNLHDGWGFYNPVWIDDMRNPKRYGESVIADAAFYIFKGDTILLEEMAKKVIAAVNEKIENPLHHFHFMNTRTTEEDTDFPEQRKSATYYALTQLGIPAFGIETSKNLPSLELKIRYHNYIINEFLKLMEVEPEHPAIIYYPPKLIYLLISINESYPQVIDNGNVIHLFKGDQIKITHIESNYIRGLSCDILGVGDEQDFNKPTIIDTSTEIIARKDNVEIGRVYIKVHPLQTDMMVYIFEVNRKKKSIMHGQTLHVKRGDKIKILDVILKGLNSELVKVNLKGYVPPVSYNNGEDRGWLIDTKQLHWKKYSVYGKGKVYPIVVTRNNVEISRVYLSIK